MDLVDMDWYEQVSGANKLVVEVEVDDNPGMDLPRSLEYMSM